MRDPTLVEVRRINTPLFLQTQDVKRDAYENRFS